MKNIKAFFRFVFIYKELSKDASKWQTRGYHCVNGIRRLLMLILLASLAATSALVYREISPKKVMADPIVNTVVVVSTSTAPVMERIAKCESGNKQLAPNGQVMIKVNTNGTTDIGVMQINSVWFSQATKLGLNLTVEKDNRAFADFLYKNYGTEAWYSSKACWSK